MDGLIDKKIQMNGWMDKKQMDGWMDGWIGKKQMVGWIENID